MKQRSTDQSVNGSSPSSLLGSLNAHSLSNIPLSKAPRRYAVPVAIMSVILLLTSPNSTYSFRLVLGIAVYPRHFLRSNPKLKEISLIFFIVLATYIQLVTPQP